MRNAGCPMHPQPRVQKYGEAHDRRHHERLTKDHAAFPAQWFYGFSRALPGDRATCHRRPRICCYAPRTLDASVGASGPHGFAVAATSLAARSFARAEPARDPRRAQNAAASTASNPASVTIAIRPSFRGETATGSETDLGEMRIKIFLIK